MLNMNIFNGLTLTNEQQRILNIYVNQHNQTNTQVQYLLNIMDEIKENIIGVINENTLRRNRQVRRSNTALNRAINTASNNRQNNYVRYDLNQPINPSVYRRNQLNTNNLRQGGFFTTILDDFLNLTVDVVPTEEQIINASRIIRYGDIETPLSESCPISLEPFNENSMVVQLLPCNHLFCQPQFNEWFRRNVRCPVCRYDIRNYRQHIENQEEPNNTEENTEENNTENTQENSPTNANLSSSLINDITSRLGTGTLSDNQRNELSSMTDLQLTVLQGLLQSVLTNGRSIPTITRTHTGTTTGTTTGATTGTNTRTNTGTNTGTNTRTNTRTNTGTRRTTSNSLSNALTDALSNAINNINNNSNPTNSDNDNNVIEFIEYISYI